MGRPVVQWQILAKNPEALSKYYSELFGWEIDADNPLGYRQVRTGAGRGIDGGIWPSPPDGHSFVQLFVEVPDMASAVAKVKALGGGVIIPPQKLPQGDEMAIVRDPEGIPMGLVQPA